MKEIIKKHIFLVIITLLFVSPIKAYASSSEYVINNYDINIDQAWTVTEGSSDIVVAVIDDGVELHEDLASNMLPGRDVVRGINNGQPVDGSSHGTAVAGIINAIKDKTKNTINPNSINIPINEIITIIKQVIKLVT